MATTKKRKRNYRREYDTYQGTAQQKKNRAKRNAARKTVEKAVGKAKLKGKDVDHKKPLSKGGSNKRSNLQITSVKYNRGVKNRKK